MGTVELVYLLDQIHGSFVGLGSDHFHGIEFDCHDVVTKKGILFMSITSMANMTSLYWSIMVTGTLDYGSFTGLTPHQTVLPFNGPNSRLYI